MNDHGAIPQEEWQTLLQAQQGRMIAEAETGKQLAEAYRTREPSKASLVGTHASESTSPAAEALRFFTAVALARGRDAGDQSIGRATLQAMGSRYIAEAPGKATVGSSGVTGGFVMVAPVVDRLVKPAAFANYLRQLMTVIPTVNAPGVAIPYRSALPTRATIQAWGELKENSSLTYGSYSASMFTLARIIDVANQLLRYSQGAAEEDVTSELGVSMALGERYYLMSGAGTTEPFGILPALAAAPATFTSSFTGAATLAGSVAKAIATCAGALAARNRIGNLSAVMSGNAYAAMVSQGTDTAGFFFAGLSGPATVNLDVPFGTLVSPWGIPVYVDSQLADDQLVVGQWKAAKVYFGQDYRLDTSSEAGERWDRNETGYRCELDMAFDGRAAVAAGAFQQVTDLLP